MLVPATASAQHGPRRHAPGSGPTYDPASEATFPGTVADMNSGRSLFSRLRGIHTLGLGHKRVQEKLVLKTDTDSVRIYLGPTAFLTERKLEIRKGDTLAVTGSRVTVGDSQIVLAREVRKVDNTWTLRDASGEPLWSSAQSEPRGFWTKTKVLLATVLRH